MAGFLLRRIGNYAVLGVLAAVLAYLLAAATLDPRANFAGMTPPPPQRSIDAALDARNLNDRTPLAERFATWAGSVAHGDFGRTWEGAPVGDELGRRAWVSVRLLLAGAALGCLLGVLLGSYAAVRRHRAADRLITFASLVILSVPVFVLAVLLQAAAQRTNDATGVTIFEWAGEYAPGAGGGSLGSRLQHLVLPTLTIALGQAAIFGRYQRNVMLDVLAADYVRAAMARGLRRRTALLKHGLRTALIPVTTYFGYTFGFLLVGGMFTEKIYGWHGLGEWVIEAIGRGDVNVVAAVGCLAALLVPAAGLVSDAAYGLLDPRVRVS